jgi:hypothetical protein
MSDFTQSLKENSAKLLWLLPSLLLHAAVLGWLIFVLRPHLLGNADANGELNQAAVVSVSTGRIQEVAAQIEVTQADEVRTKVEELLAAEKTLADLEKQKEAEVALLSQELAAAAPQLAGELLSAAEAAQARADAAQKEALTATQGMEAGRAKLNEILKSDPDWPGDNKVVTPEKQQAIDELVAAANQAAAAQGRAKEAQTQVTAAQTTAAQRLAFRDEAAFADARAAQAKAAAAQTEANNRLDDAAALTGDVIALKQNLTGINNNLRNAADGVKWRQERLRNWVEAEQRINDNLAKARENLAQTKDDLAQAEQKAQAAVDDKAKNTANRELESAKKRQEALQKEIARNESALEKGRADKVKLDGGVQQENNKITKQTQALVETAQRYQEAPAKARATQEAALAAQQQATAAQGLAIAALAQAAANAGAPPAAAKGNESPVPQIDLAPQNFAELYQTAVDTESRLAKKFQTVRAAELAVQRQIPISEAQKYVEVAKPSRPQYQPPAKPLQDAAALAGQNARMDRVLQELDSMVALARSMVYQASNSALANQGVTVSVTAVKRQAAQAEQLASLAAENEEVKAVDVSGMMKQIANDDAGEGQGAGKGQGTGQGGLGGAGTGSGKGFGPGAGGGVPILDSVNGAVAGRKIFQRGTSEAVTGTQWMFVDSWYVIGPFPNPQRRNIDTKFPPESVVDLDAHYQLENGDNLRWRYVRNTKPEVRPPDERSYAIYYAYTTLWADAARDVWFAVGSDDYSKIWVNNMLVWASGMKHKSWRPNEGFRKVHLQKGLNHILYRIENGQNACTWSLMINMQSLP